MPEGGPELEDIVRDTDERPFAVQANSSCFVLLIKACSSEGGRSLPLYYRNIPTQANPARSRLLRFLVVLLRYMLLGLLSLVNRASLNQRT